MKTLHILFGSIFGAFTFMFPLFLMKTVSFPFGCVSWVVFFTIWCLVLDKIENSIDWEDEEGFYEN